jgi:hypothetical protein
VNELGRTEQKQPARSAATVVAEAARSGALAVSSKKVRKSPTIGSRSASQPGNKLKAVQAQKTINVFVSRVASDSTEEDIVEYAKGIITGSDDFSVKCTELQTKFDTYSSFHVSIRLNVSRFSDTIKCIMSGDNWPEGVLVRRYFLPRKAHRNGDIESTSNNHYSKNGEQF